MQVGTPGPQNPFMLNPLQGAMANPLLMVGLQLLNNNRRQPRSQYQGPLAGVNEAMMGAAYQQRMQQQDLLQQEQLGRQREEWKHQDAERQRREQATAALQGMLGGQGQQLPPDVMADEPPSVQAMGAPQYPNPLNPQAIQSVMMGGDSAMQNAAITNALRGQNEHRPVVVGNSLVDPMTGKPIYTAPDDPYKLTFEQRKELANSRAGAETAPSNWREWELYNSLSPERRQEYLAMKRGLDFLNAGNQFVAPNPASPAGPPVSTVPISLKPGEEPDVRRRQATAAAVGKETGAAASTLLDNQAAIPHLKVVAKELSDLGKKATYTMVGQGVNAARRQLGLGVGGGAKARAEYIAKVDNEVLPLLRSTFGAQFTQKEGESLKATLGDPNKSPEEKDAILNAFIDAKTAQIKTGERRVGNQSLPSAGMEISPNQGGIKFVGWD